MNNKELEAKAVQFLISKLSADGYECVDLRSDRSKGWDLEAIKDGVTYPIEVKSTRAIKRKDTNLRFTWQTLCSAYRHNVLNNLILAVVTCTLTDEPKVQYSRFCDVKAGEILVEPHFIIQLNRLKRREGMAVYESLKDLPTGYNDMMERFKLVVESPLSRWVNI